MLAIVLPAAAVVLALAFGGRRAERIVLVALPAGLAIAVAIVAGVWRARTPLQYLVGGWAPPLGIALRADGLSAIMLVTTALVIGAIGLFAREGFSHAGGRAGGAGVAGILDAADGRLGRAECRLARRRPVHAFMSRWNC